MGSNLPVQVGSMQQSRHKNFELNHSLMKKQHFFGEKVLPIGLPSQQGIDFKRDERDRKW
jgi:hypothetical protein